MPDAQTVPLSGGGLLQVTGGDDFSQCGLSRLDQHDGLWHCYTLPGYVEGATLRQDSRGWLTQLSTKSPFKNFALGLSPDGGKTWQSITLTPPEGGTQTGGSPFYDVKVNGALGIAVVDTRLDGPEGAQQDLVFRVDISKPTPRLVETDLVGDGKLSPAHDVSGALGDRMDFASVAILPDGRLTMSFDDSTTSNPTPTKPTGHSPELAVQLPRVVPPPIHRPPPVHLPPVGSGGSHGGGLAATGGLPYAGAAVLLVGLGLAVRRRRRA